ncbi:hypothetical protein I3760_06G055700 [Carya illinoinensis]|nr:hypothetical protein I3760_06G055700 [Carya illinoinensis]
MGLLAWARWTSGEILGRMDFRRDIGPNVTFGMFFGKDMFLGHMGFWRVWKTGDFGLCALGMFHASCLSYMCFYLVVFGVLLTCGTICGSVAFGAGVEEEEEEAEPEDAAPPGC